MKHRDIEIETEILKENRRQWWTEWERVPVVRVPERENTVNGEYFEEIFPEKFLSFSETCKTSAMNHKSIVKWTTRSLYLAISIILKMQTTKDKEVS